MSAAIQSPNLSMGWRLELSQRVYSLLVNLLVYDSTPRDFFKGSEDAGDGLFTQWKLIYIMNWILPWAFNGTMPWISIRDHPLGLVHFIYCPSFFFFCLMKDILAKAVYINKKEKRGLSWVRWLFGVVPWKCDWYMGFWNSICRNKRDWLSPPFQVGIISQVFMILLLGSGLRVHDWSSALRLASHPIFHLIALSSFRESVKV